MLALYTLTTAEIGARAQQGLWAVLDPAERARADRFRRPADRETYVAAHGLTRVALGRLLDTAPAALRFAPRTAQGKPGLVGGPADLDFNLSHTDGLVACALARGALVGVDVEREQRRIEDDIAGRMYAPDELAWLDRQPGGRSGPGMLALWTMKEAYIKALGLGLSLETTSFSVGVDPAVLARDGGSLPAGRHCRFIRRRPTADHLLALAVIGPAGALPDPIEGDGVGLIAC